MRYDNRLQVASGQSSAFVRPYAIVRLMSTRFRFIFFLSWINNFDTKPNPGELAGEIVVNNVAAR